MNIVENKFKSLDEMSYILLSEMNSPRKVVLTTGVFDVPHVGHPRYLNAAKELGNLLVVGVHSDELVRKRKGENRPIYPSYERIEFLSYYSSVDFILELKDQNEVYRVIRQLHPDVLVVSETTEDIDNCPKTMGDLFGDFIKVKVLKPQSERHSTDVIQGMKWKKSQEQKW